MRFAATRRRYTIPSRSASPQGATTSSCSPGSSRTATAVAVSGQVATPSAVEASGSTSKPNTLGYQRWTAAWVLAFRIEESQVDVARRRRLGATVEAVPDEVPQRAAAKEPVRRPHVPSGE